MLNILLCIRQTHNTASGEVETLCSALAHTGASQVLTTELLKDACGTSVKEENLHLAECL